MKALQVSIYRRSEHIMSATKRREGIVMGLSPIALNRYLHRHASIFGQLAFVAGSLATTFAFAQPTIVRAQIAPSGGASANSAPSSSQGSAASGHLADLDLDQLMNVQVKVTSVSKKEEDSFQAPAAIFVLTA